MNERWRQRASVIRYWRAVEVFTPGTVNRIDHGRTAGRPGEGMYPVSPGKALPWQPHHPVASVRLRPNQTWQYVIYGGVFGLDLLYERMAEAFGEGDVDFDERLPRGDTALFSMMVDAQGRPDLESLVLSTAAWGLGRAKRPGPGDPTWLDGFDRDGQRHRDMVAAMISGAEAARKAGAWGDDWDDEAVDPDMGGLEPDDGDKSSTESPGEAKPASRALEHDDLLAIVHETANLMGLAGLADWRIRIQARLIPIPKPGQDEGADRGEEGFLNSFHLNDLERVADAADAGNIGEALGTFLTEDTDLDVLSRTNVRDEAQIPLLRELLAPSRVPAGRWPSRAAHSLASSQQLAVGQIMQQLADNAGTFSVNGPPGTGKTTMLRDVIAAVVVSRAEQLARLTRPKAAFAQKLTWRIDQREHHVRAINSALTGFEMVIASENNGAVENVTRQIPAASEIDEFWRGTADYFSEHAERLLGVPAWGLIAAPLGNMVNRQRFVKQFWFGDPQRGVTVSATAAADSNSQGFRGFLWTADPSSVDWTAEVRAFRDAVAAQDRLQAERIYWDHQLTEGAHLAVVVPEIRVRLEEVNALVREAEESAARAVSATDAAEARERAAEDRRTEHVRRRPGGMETLFTWGKAARRWHAEDEQLRGELQEARQLTLQAVLLRTKTESTLLAEQVKAIRVRDELKRNERRLAEAEKAVMTAMNLWQEDFPDDSWWMDERRRELAGPWLDERWNEARSEVFIAALRLHAAFVVATADVLRQNLDTTRLLLQGQVPRDLSEPIARTAWQTLFLVMPVVSTTFASLPRLFRHLSREALGWLFIDEAGQARPQSVVGALWRSRRVVAVGDPLQLEPVLTVLNTTQQALRRHYGVARIWAPSGTCVQTLADRLADLGTWLPGPGQEPVWVGAPLRVHRRCDEPMFSLVNRLAYDGMMVQATPPREHPLAVVETRWVDVAGAAGEGNWVPAEGDAAEQILDYLLRQQGLEPRQIFVISPFRAVVTGLKRRLRDHRDVQISTVHKTQGQERDVVLLVLGSDPNRPGARAWAAQKPNLLNVAVSRAKQRLYVIGNHSAWAGQPNFDLLARTLERKPFTPRSR